MIGTWKKLNQSKIKLRQTEVKFMGHLITKDGLKPDPDKVSAIKNMPKPTTKAEVQTLLRFVNYLSKFMPKLSAIIQSLRDLTAPGAQFVWSTQHETAFQTIKDLICKQPVLRYYDVNEEVTVQTDASNAGFGAVLMQEGQPVAFALRTLSKTEQRYAPIEKECLAIVFGLERFYQYLARRELIHVETDHKPLETIFKKSVLTAPCRLQRMLLRIQRYNVSVKYKPGSQMLIADHLSRAAQTEVLQPDDTYQVFLVDLEATSLVQTLNLAPEKLEQIQKCTGEDAVLQTLKTTVLCGWPESRDLVPVNVREFWNYRDEIGLHNGVLFKGSRVIIPKVMRPEVMLKIHSSHQGAEACLRRARDSVFWPNMNAEVRERVSNCETCSEFAANNQKEPLQTHEIPERPWSKVAADQFDLFKKDYIVPVDFYSDYLEVKRLKSNTSTAVINFLKEQFARYGIPETFLSDNATQFTSDEFKQFAQEWEFKHVTSSPHHHRSNGKVESAVKIAKSLIKKAQRDGRDPMLALLHQRNTPTAEIGTSPMQRLMSRRGRTRLPVATQLLQPEVTKVVQDKLKLRTQKAKMYHGRTARRLPELEIGQEVMLAPLRRNDTWKRGTCTEKLSDRSYMVKADGSDRSLRRNRVFLRPAPDVEVNEEVQVPQNSAQAEEPAPLVQEQQDVQSERRTRTRQVKMPARFRDFEL